MAASLTGESLIVGKREREALADVRDDGRRRFQHPCARRADEQRRERGTNPQRAFASFAMFNDRRWQARRGSTLGDPLQLQEQVVRALKSRVRIFREADADDTAERWRRERLQLDDRRRIATEDRGD